MASKEDYRLVRNERARRRNALKAVFKCLPEEIEEKIYSYMRRTDETARRIDVSMSWQKHPIASMYSKLFIYRCLPRQMYDRNIFVGIKEHMDDVTRRGWSKKNYIEGFWGTFGQSFTRYAKKRILDRIMDEDGDLNNNLAISIDNERPEKGAILEI